MAEPYIGEIRIFAGTYAPAHWAFCDGQILPISGNEALFSLIGTTYGGNGRSTFQLPDMRGRIPVHQNPGSYYFLMGQRLGAESVALDSSNLPQHSHQMQASESQASSNIPINNVLAKTDQALYEEYDSDVSIGSMNPEMIQKSGKSLEHTNLQPFLCLNFIIALQGTYPSRT